MSEKVAHYFECLHSNSLTFGRQQLVDHSVYKRKTNTITNNISDDLLFFYTFQNRYCKKPGLTNIYCQVIYLFTLSSVHSNFSITLCVSFLIKTFYTKQKTTTLSTLSCYLKSLIKYQISAV